MDLTNTLHLTGLEIGLIFLVIALALALVLSKRASPSTKKEIQSLDMEGLKEWVKESEAICESLSKNLQEKRKIVKRLITQMDGKIDQIHQLLQKVDEAVPIVSDEDKNKGLYPQIVEMANAGCQASQIARWLKVPEGEVQLVLDLKKFGHSEESKGSLGPSRMEPVT